MRTPSDAEENFTLGGYIGQTASGIQAFAAFLPNMKFAPEQLNGYELGYRRLFGKNILVDFAGFLNRYHDLFDEEIITYSFLESDTPPPVHLLLPAQFRNGLLGRSTGFELAPEWRPIKFWRLRGSYSYLDLVLRKSPGSGDLGISSGSTLNVDAGGTASNIVIHDLYVDPTGPLGWTGSPWFPRPPPSWSRTPSTTPAS